MEGRLKLVVVYNGVQPLHALDILVGMQQKFDIEIVSLASEEHFRHYRLAIPVKIFETINQMPGYLRGLEQLVADADLVLCFGSYDLTTFQASRACLRYNRPLLVLTNPVEPFNANVQPEWLALHQEIVQQAQEFVAFSELAVETLKVEGVDPHKIRCLRPYHGHEAGIYTDKGRRRLREYLGLGLEENVLLVKDLAHQAMIKAFLDALKRLEHSRPEGFDKLRVLFANCEVSSEMQHRMVDLKLGSHVLLLNQSITPFENDLYSAVDVVFDPNRVELGECFDFWILDAVRAGGIPIAWHQAPGVHAVAQRGHVLQSNDYQSIARVLEESIDQLAHESREQRVVRAQELLSDYQPTHVSDQLAAIVGRCFHEHACPTLKARHDFNQLEQIVDSLLERGQWSVANQLLAEWEPAIEDLSKIQRSRFWYLRGELDLAQAAFDAAIKAFETSLRLDPQACMAVLGLAKISLLTHAEEDAVAFYKKALALKPNLAEAYEGIGLVYRRKGLIDDAVYWFEQAVLLQPDQPRSLLELTQTCLECEDVRDAISTLEQVRLAIGDRSSLIMALGQLYLSDGKFEQGQEMVNRALADQEKSRVVNS